jgi:large subunit ribosomal protein L17
MRHAKKNNHLGRTSAHREAMLSNMAASLLLHKRISTTLAKAKELRKYIEPMITRSKDDTTHSRRVVFSYLQNKFAVSELFREISQKVGNRPGGYTRILKTGFRKGDNAEMCIIELVDYNETYTIHDDKKKTTKTRRSRGGKGKTEHEPKPHHAVETPTTELPITDESVVVEEPIVEKELVEEKYAEELPANEQQ